MRAAAEFEERTWLVGRPERVRFELGATAAEVSVNIPPNLALLSRRTEIGDDGGRVLELTVVALAQGRVEFGPAGAEPVVAQAEIGAADATFAEWIEAPAERESAPESVSAWVAVAVLVLLCAGIVFWAWKRRRPAVGEGVPDEVESLAAGLLERIERWRGSADEPAARAAAGVELATALRELAARSLHVEGHADTVEELVARLERGVGGAPARALDRGSVPGETHKYAGRDVGAEEFRAALDAAAEWAARVRAGGVQS